MVVDAEFILAVKVGPVGVPIAKVAPVADPLPPNELLIVAVVPVVVVAVDPPIDIIVTEILWPKAT